MRHALGRRLSLAFFLAYERALGWLGRNPPYGILTLEVGGEISEDGHDGPLPPWLKRAPFDYLSLLAVLRWARDDAQLRGVVLRCKHLEVSWARIQGLRRSLMALRRAGKKVWVHLDCGGLPEYYLATAGERISLAPGGSLDVVGMSAETVFFLDALETIGVRAEVVQVGAYKAAGESFTRRAMSAEHREMVEALVDDLFGQIVDDVAAARGMDAAAVREAIDAGPFLADDARERGLIDATEYADETETAMKGALADPPMIEAGAYAVRRRRAVRLRMLRAPVRRIAIVHICGAIKQEQGALPLTRGRGAAAATLQKCFKDLREREEVDAVVVRVASPGGSGLASDLIWHEVSLTAAVKPLFVSFGDVAASGGYYVGLPARRIFAEAGTITGSIGVLAGKANLRGLYEKIGVRKDFVTRGRHATLHSDYTPLGEAERERIAREANAFYGLFIRRVADGRNMSAEQVEASAGGRVWTGRQAQVRGLVDEIGGLEEACDAARAAIGIAAEQPVAVERLPRPQSFWRAAIGRELGTGSHAWDLRDLAHGVPFRSLDRVWLRLPFDLNIR